MKDTQSLHGFNGGRFHVSLRGGVRRMLLAVSRGSLKMGRCHERALFWESTVLAWGLGPTSLPRPLCLNPRDLRHLLLHCFLVTNDSGGDFRSWAEISLGSSPSGLRPTSEVCVGDPGLGHVISFRPSHLHLCPAPAPACVPCTLPLL